VEHPNRHERVLRRPARAFTLVEIVVAVVIVAIMAAITVPTMVDRLRQNEANALVSELENIQTGIALFQRDVGRYPFRLDYLSTLFDSVSIRDFCGVAISATNQAKYRGPYITRPILPVSPYTVPINTRDVLATGDSIETLISRVTLTTGDAIQLSVKGPSDRMTLMVDSIADGTADATGGRVRYATPLQSNQNTIGWLIPIPKNGC
jgi:general secretion pathway protein G